MEVHKALRLPRNLHLEVHQALRLPRNLRMEVHKVRRPSLTHIGVNGTRIRMSNLSYIPRLQNDMDAVHTNT